MLLPYPGTCSHWWGPLRLGTFRGAKWILKWSRGSGGSRWWSRRVSRGEPVEFAADMPRSAAAGMAGCDLFNDALLAEPAGNGISADSAVWPFSSRDWSWHLFLPLAPGEHQFPVFVGLRPLLLSGLREQRGGVSVITSWGEFLQLLKVRGLEQRGGAAKEVI